MSKLNATFPMVKNAKTVPVLSATEYPIMGNSRAMSRVRNQIAFSAQVRFPIFLSGEIGTEKSSIARQVHESRGLPIERFIDVPSNIHDLAGYKRHFEKSILDARGGTLYLSEVDLLSDVIKDYLITMLSGDGLYKSINQYEINLIISCTNPLISNHGNPQYIAKIFGCSVPHLEIHIPALRERKEDLHLHIHYLLNKVSLRHRLSLDSVALELLVHYDWPENLDQLQRVLCLLASYCESEITQEDILELNLIKSTQDEPDVIGMILLQDFESFKHFHPGLKKALIYIGENFKEDMTLITLSNIACTSPSHLSFLFRNHLNLSFKTILVQVRVRYAKQLIETSPRLKITDISLQAGFGDLSHFEKMFKRYVGYTPRQHRQKLRLESNLLVTV